MDFLIWLEESLIGIWVAQSVWGHPIVLSSHAVGMAIVVGTVLMINLRILGFARNVPLTLFSNLSVVAWFGVTLNVLSGLALFSGDPTKFFYLPIFRIKISLILLGVLSVWWVLGTVRGARQENGITEASFKVKVVAAFSSLFWVSAIVAGRLIAYIEIF